MLGRNTKAAGQYSHAGGPGTPWRFQRNCKRVNSDKLGRHPFPNTVERRRQEEDMIKSLYIAAAVIDAVVCLYLVWRYRDARKFLAGAFFVSSGYLFYLYLAHVSVPLLGTSFVETPQVSGGRSIVHFILFLLCVYFGFIRKPKA